MHTMTSSYKPIGYATICVSPPFLARTFLDVYSGNTVGTVTFFSILMSLANRTAFRP